MLKPETFPLISVLAFAVAFEVRLRQAPEPWLCDIATAVKSLYGTRFQVGSESRAAQADVLCVPP